jgi:hypothetical protein
MLAFIQRPRRAVVIAACVMLTGSISASRSFADVITLLYSCDGCSVLPLPSVIKFDPATQLFEDFTVRYDTIDFDFTFPNLQPDYVRQWLWDALSGRPVKPTAVLSDGRPAEVFPVYWDAYAYDTAACFRFLIGASGAGYT